MPTRRAGHAGLLNSRAHRGVKYVHSGPNNLSWGIQHIDRCDSHCSGDHPVSSPPLAYVRAYRLSISLSSPYTSSNTLNRLSKVSQRPTVCGGYAPQTKSYGRLPSKEPISGCRQTLTRAPSALSVRQRGFEVSPDPRWLNYQDFSKVWDHIFIEYS